MSSWNGLIINGPLPVVSAFALLCKAYTVDDNAGFPAEELIVSKPIRNAIERNIVSDFMIFSLWFTTDIGYGEILLFRRS